MPPIDPTAENSPEPPTSSLWGKASDRPDAIYKVPRRFNLATVFVVTFFYAAFLGIMQSFEAPIDVQVGIMTILSLVALVQMFVSEKYVRIAAIACGWVVFAFAGVYRSASWQDAVFMLIFTTPIFGSLLGYCAGVVVAGVFLVADYVRIAWRAVLRWR